MANKLRVRRPPKPLTPAGKLRAQREKDLSDERRAFRAQRVKEIRDIAHTWDAGNTKDYAAQLRASARVMAADPDFWNMRKQAKVWGMIKSRVTAETEAMRDRQSARGKKPRPRAKGAKQGSLA